MGVTCPEGWEARHEDDDHKPQWSSNPNWHWNECCYLSCGTVGFDGQCGAGQAPRDPDEGHHCFMYGEGGVTDAADAACSADECCRYTCDSAQGLSELTCPAGMGVAEGEECCMVDCDEHPWERACDSMAEAESDDDDAERGCCFTPYVISAIGAQLAPGTTTNLNYDINLNFFTDAACTVSTGDLGAAGVTGTSAACAPGNHGGDTPFGLYAYCPGVTGEGAFEYILGEAQCPPAPGSQGGEWFCACHTLSSLLAAHFPGRRAHDSTPPSGLPSLTAPLSSRDHIVWSADGEVVAVNECVCHGEDEYGNCEEYMKLTCTAQVGPPPQPPTLEEILARGIVATPEPVVIEIVAEVLDASELEAAAFQVAAALAEPPADGAPPPPPPREIKSEMSFFPIAAETVTAVVAEDSRERAEFETSFKTAMATSLGGGAFQPDDIDIVSVTAGSVVVDFKVVVPAAVTQVLLHCTCPQLIAE